MPIVIDKDLQQLAIRLFFAVTVTSLLATTLAINIGRDVPVFLPSCRLVRRLFQIHFRIPSENGLRNFQCSFLISGKHLNYLQDIHYIGGEWKLNPNEQDGCRFMLLHQYFLVWRISSILTRHVDAALVFCVVIGLASLVFTAQISNAAKLNSRHPSSCS